MNAPPQPRERRRQERDFSGRRDGVRDKVNEFRARRDRRDEKSRNDRRGGALGARAWLDRAARMRVRGPRAVGKQGAGGVFLESAKMFTASGNAFVTL